MGETQSEEDGKHKQATGDLHAVHGVLQDAKPAEIEVPIAGSPAVARGNVVFVTTRVG